MNTPARTETRKFILTDDEKDLCGVDSIKLIINIPAIYDDMDNIDNNRISERYPKFGFGDLLDEILDDFGGVLDIFVCEWDDVKLEGEVVCLMKDWRVFRYFLKQNDIASLDREKRISLINKDCLIFEDIDDWCAWKEELESQKQSVQDYVTDLEDFFNGNFDKIQKKMQKNKGV